MEPLGPGTDAPPIPGVAFDGDPMVLFFYKVSCPVCQMTAPKVEVFERAYPGRIVGIGQDPPPKLDAFGRQHRMSFRSVSDEPPYPASKAYGIRVVPTAFLIGPDGQIRLVVESWDRDRYNDLSRAMAEAAGRPFAPVSERGDGLPSFRPG